MAKTHIGHIETGRRWPKPESLEAIARALEVPVQELFRDSDYVPQATPEEALQIIQKALEKKNLDK